MVGSRRLGGAVLVLGAIAATGGPSAGGVDSVLLEGATIEVGAAPTPGTLVVDGCATEGTPPAAPAAPNLGTMETFTFPAFPGAGPGGEDFVAGESSVYLGGGVHDFASLTVPAGNDLYFSGDATVRVTGDVVLDGNIDSDGSLTIHCGGSFSGNDYIVADGGPLVLEVQGPVTLGSAANLDAEGDLVLHAHSPGTTDLGGAEMDANAGGSITVNVAGGLVAGGADLDAHGGSTTVRVAGGDLVADDLTLYGETAIDLLVLDGDLLVSDLYLRSYYGRGRILASGSIAGEDWYVDVSDSESTGDLECVSFGGDIDLTQAGFEISGSGFLLLAASGSVSLELGGDVESDDGSLTVAALGGDLVIRDGEGEAGVYSDGEILLRAAGALRLGEAAERTDARGGSTTLYGAAAVEFHGTVQGQTGAVLLLSPGPVTVRGYGYAETRLEVISTGDSVDVAGAELASNPFSANPKSGDVLVATFGRPNAILDATGALVRSADHAIRSGDVSLMAYGEGPCEVPTLDLAVLKGKLRDKPDPGKDSATAKGTFAFLPDSPDGVFDVSTEAAVIRLGDPGEPLEVTVSAGDPGWKVKRKGRLLNFKSARGALPKLKIKIDLDRGTFQLKAAKADFPAAPGATVAVGLEIGDDLGTAAEAWPEKKPGLRSYKAAK